MLDFVAVVFEWIGITGNRRRGIAVIALTLVLATVSIVVVL